MPRRRRRRRNRNVRARARGVAPGRRRGLLGVLGEPRGRVRRGAVAEGVRRAGAAAEGVGRPGRRVWGGVGAPGECRARQRVRRGAGRAHAQESVPPRPHRDERRVQECAFSQARRRVRGRAVARLRRRRTSRARSTPRPRWRRRRRPRRPSPGGRPATSAARHDAAFGSPRSPRAGRAGAGARQAKAESSRGGATTRRASAYYFNMETGDGAISGTSPTPQAALRRGRRVDDVER